MNIVALLLCALQAPPAVPSGPPSPAQPLVVPACVDALRDQANPANCLLATSVPTPGLLFPPPHDGGLGNTQSGLHAFVGGGMSNSASGQHAAIAGGWYNEALGTGTCIAGGRTNVVVGNTAAVGGGSANTAVGSGTVRGGRSNDVSSRSTISGGYANSASYYYATVVGGRSNYAFGNGAAIGGGSNNGVGFSLYSNGTVLGGVSNFAGGYDAVIAGGHQNGASSTRAAVAGGFGNTANGGDYPTAGGGEHNTALGNYSFAAGRRAKANPNGSFVWGSSQDIDKGSLGANGFDVHASGGTRIFSSSPPTTGVLLAPGSGTWSSVSDRACKENLAPVDGSGVLESVAALPISTWNYETQADTVRHMGPTAQDFRGAFGLGQSEKLIDTVDPAGVALAALQRLNELVELQQRELDELRRVNGNLKERLARLASDAAPRALDDGRAPPADAAPPLPAPLPFGAPLSPCSLRRIQ